MGSDASSSAFAGFWVAFGFAIRSFDAASDPSTQVALQPELSPMCHHHDSDANSNRMEQRTSASSLGSDILPSSTSMLPSDFLLDQSTQVALPPELSPTCHHHDSGSNFSEIISAVEDSWRNNSYDLARDLLREIVNCPSQYKPKLISLFERVAVQIIITANDFEVTFTAMQRNRNGGKYCETSEKDGPLNALLIQYGKERKNQMSRDGPDRDGKEWLVVGSSPGAEGENWDYFNYLDRIFWLFSLKTQSCINMGLKLFDYEEGLSSVGNLYILSSQQPNAPGVGGPRVADFRELAFNYDEFLMFSKVGKLLHSKKKKLSWTSAEGNQKFAMYLPSDRYTEPSEVIVGGFECQNDAFPGETNPIPIGHTKIARPIHVPETENNAAFSAENYPRNMMNCKHKAPRRKIAFKRLQPYFDKKLEVAVKELNVSQSTVKRICRENGIYRWPSSVKGKSSATIRDQTASQHPEAFVVCQQESQHPQPPESLVVENVLPISSASTIEQTRFASLEGSKRRKMECFHEKKRKNSSNSLCQSVPINPPDERMVIIKATYGEDTIKFKFSSKSGFEQLNKEISKRINLKTGSFNIKYWDSDQELILITREDGLKDCLEMLGSHDNDTIKLQVHEKVAK
ncbi:hypothetical protein NMG60_11004457 [Bertholletia excelsa]